MVLATGDVLTAAKGRKRSIMSKEGIRLHAVCQELGVYEKRERVTRLSSVVYSVRQA
jgi:hypothetical protein